MKRVKLELVNFLQVFSKRRVNLIDPFRVAVDWNLSVCGEVSENENLGRTCEFASIQWHDTYIKSKCVQTSQGKVNLEWMNCGMNSESVRIQNKSQESIQWHLYQENTM